MEPKLMPQTEEVQQANTDPIEFSAQVIRTAVSQICKSIGFRAVQISVLEVLTDVATRHLQLIGRAAVSYANAANRTEPNVFDLVNALNDLNSAKGFKGASDLHVGPLLRSGTLSDLIQFVEWSHEIPFAKPISCSSSSNLSVSLALNSVGLRESVSRLKHVPMWLPDFPDSGTFKESHEELGRSNKRKYELWGDTVSYVPTNGRDMIGTVKRRTQAKNGKPMGKLKFRICGTKNGHNGIRKGGAELDEGTEGSIDKG